MAAPDEYPLSFLVQVVTKPTTLYRVCKASDTHASELIEDFRSNYERKPDKVRKLDAHATVIQMALSMWHAFDDAQRMSHAFPRLLGEHIARLEIEPDYGVCLAETGAPAHRSVWGRPAQLLSFVAEVVRA